MNISLDWLRSLAPGLQGSAEEIAARLADSGAPVEEMISLGDPVSTLLVGRVKGVSKHPNADRLSICEVDIGSTETLQVICGAPNVEVGAYYPFAPVGSELPGGIKIRRARIRGVESEGMLCSEREIGLGRDQSGIMRLSGELTPGEDLVGALGLDDIRLVIDLTPNRPDLLSHLGVARELATGGVAGLELPEFPGHGGSLREEVDLVRADREAETGGLLVTLEDTVGCPRYLGAVIRGVEIGPSPAWLANRLRAIGLRPINNVVDATNYILFELGQPLHAFDLDRLSGPEIRIRRASPGEGMRTLDGEDRLLDEAMTVIADAAVPVAIAGVMGGEDSQVTGATTNIFLECALFDPHATRKTRSAIGLSTDASYRFERGVDPIGMESALRRAIDLIIAVAGGEPAATGVDLYPEPITPPKVMIRGERTSKLLGVHFSIDQIISLLEPLGFDVLDRGPHISGDEGEAVHFQVPGYRSYDVRREVDLIEEVARRYGYDRFPSELRPFRPGELRDDPISELEDRLRDLIVGLGFLEARLSPFVQERDGDLGPINPLSTAERMLRRTLVPGLLRRVESNFKHGVRSVRLFEIGTIFSRGVTPTDPPVEATHLALVMSGPTSPLHWSRRVEPYDLWDLKGIMTRIAGALSTDLALEVARSSDPLLRPGHAYQVVDSNGEVVGSGGRIEDDEVDAPAWAGPTYALEFSLRDDLVERVMPTFEPLPSYPSIERDAALLVPDQLPAAEVEATIRRAGGNLLEGVTAFDLFRGPGVPEGHRSIAYRLRFRAPDRTLTDREADRAFSRVLERLREEHGVQRRG